MRRLLDSPDGRCGTTVVGGVGDRAWIWFNIAEGLAVHVRKPTEKCLNTLLGWSDDGARGKLPGFGHVAVSSK